jgi:hypothetical protein
LEELVVATISVRETPEKHREVVVFRKYVPMVSFACGSQRNLERSRGSPPNFGHYGLPVMAFASSSGIGIAATAVIVFAALLLTDATTARAEEPLTTSAAQISASPANAASIRDDVGAFGKDRNNVGIRGHGFVRDNGRFTTIDVPGARAFTVIFGIDDDGRTAGGYVDARGRMHGFLLRGDTFITFDAPGAFLESLLGDIDDHGRIVGTTF